MKRLHLSRYFLVGFLFLILSLERAFSADQQFHILNWNVQAQHCFEQSRNFDNYRESKRFKFEPKNEDELCDMLEDGTVNSDVYVHFHQKTKKAVLANPVDLARSRFDDIRLTFFPRGVRYDFITLQEVDTDLLGKIHDLCLEFGYSYIVSGNPAEDCFGNKHYIVTIYNKDKFDCIGYSTDRFGNKKDHELATGFINKADKSKIVIVNLHLPVLKPENQYYEQNLRKFEKSLENWWNYSFNEGGSYLLIVGDTNQTKDVINEILGSLFYKDIRYQSYIGSKYDHALSNLPLIVHKDSDVEGYTDEYPGFFDHEILYLSLKK